MKPATRAELQAIQDKLQSIDENFQVRDEGTVKFKDARVLLQNLIDQPDDNAAPPPITANMINEAIAMAHPDAGAAMRGLFADLDTKLDTIELHLATLMGQPA